MTLDSKKLISAIRQDLLAAQREGILDVPAPGDEAEIARNVSLEWQEFFAETGGFVLSHIHTEFLFQNKGKSVDFLMPKRIDLSDEGTGFGWFCVVSRDGQPGSVWYLSDGACFYGYPDLSLWIKAILDEHRVWMNCWQQFGSPDPETDEDQWTEMELNFAPQSLDSAIRRAAEQRTIIYRDELLDFRQAKFGEHLDFRWNLSVADEEGVFYCKRHTLIQRLKIWLGWL